MRSLGIVLILELLVLTSACDEGVDCSAEGACPSPCEVDPGSAACCENEPEFVTCPAPCEENPAQSVCRSACDQDPTAPHCVPEAFFPASSVDVVRDELGVAHILADTDADAMWASGYTQALDRLFQMDLLRRRALGRRAEVLGSGYVGDDELMRIVDIAGWAERGALALRQMHPELYALVVAWTAGVNARIAEVHSGEVPTPYGFGTGEGELEYEPELWRINDGFAVGKLMLFGTSNQLQNDLLATVVREYLPEAWAALPFVTPLTDAFTLPPSERPDAAARMTSRQVPAALPAARPAPDDAAERLTRFLTSVATPGQGSNNWAIAGRHTQSGRPLISGDPHLAMSSPNVFWLHHIRSSEGLDVAGFSFVGAPGVHLGHNRHIVWTATINFPDTMDLWEVRANEGAVRIGDEWVPIRRRNEVIQVAGADPVEVTLDSVPGYGVILPEGYAPVPIVRSGGRLLFNWTGFAPTQEFHTFHQFMIAEDVDDFEAAASQMEIGSFNLVAADDEEIAYVSSMWVPIRRGAFGPDRQPWTVMNGSDIDSFWSDARLDRSLLPSSRGGERGWVATANNDPFGFTADGDLAADPFYFGAYYAPGARAHRVHEEIERLVADGGITTEDLRTLQLDSYSVLASRLMPILRRAMEMRNTEEELAEYRDRADLESLFAQLDSWDLRMDRDQSAPVVFTGWINFLTRLTLEDELSFAFDPVQSAEPIYLLKLAVLALEGAFESAPEILDRSPELAVLMALEQTATWLEVRFGGIESENYTWGDYHQIAFDSPVDGPLEIGDHSGDGGDGTVNVATAPFFEGVSARRMHRARGGAVYRMVAEFEPDGLPRAQINFAPGTVGEPSSPFFRNTLEDYLTGQYRDLAFRAEDIEAAAVGRITVPQQ